MICGFGLNFKYEVKDMHSKGLIANLQVEVVRLDGYDDLADFAEKVVGGQRYINGSGKILKGNMPGLPHAKFYLRVSDNLTALANCCQESMVSEKKSDRVRDWRPYVILEGKKGKKMFLAIVNKPDGEWRFESPDYSLLNYLQEV
jgi:hypothetical protein